MVCLLFTLVHRGESTVPPKALLPLLCLALQKVPPCHSSHWEGGRVEFSFSGVGWGTILGSISSLLPQRQSNHSKEGPQPPTDFPSCLFPPSCSCAGAGFRHLLASLPHRQDNLHQLPEGFPNDAFLPVFQYLCLAAFLLERLHQPHPLQPHLKEIPGSGLSIAGDGQIRRKSFFCSSRRPFCLH